MNHPTSTTPDHRAPTTDQIVLNLPLATIEEVDNLADLHHQSREHTLREIINAALLSDTPQAPAGPDATGRLAQHAQLTHQRSLELALTRNES